MLWWTDHETGDSSDWTRDGRGDDWTAGAGSTEIVASPTRSGRYALRSTVSTLDGSLSAGIVTRNQGLPVEAFYSVWYLVTRPATPVQDWTFFKFRSRTVASDPYSTGPAWDLRLVLNEEGGAMSVILVHATEGNMPAVAVPTPPVGKWFQVEAFLRATNDDSGRLTVWLDGTTIFDLAGRSTMPSSYVEWSVGGLTEALVSPATLCFDDAAISTRRLGPAYPVFWREP
jgi:hypothetical protein